MCVTMHISEIFDISKKDQWQHNLAVDYTTVDVLQCQMYQKVLLEADAQQYYGVLLSAV